MPDATAPSEPAINDELPANAEVLGEDSEQISALLARFGMGPEALDESGKVGERESGTAAPAAVATEQPATESTAVPAAGEVSTDSPAAIVPAVDEAAITQRIEEASAAKAKEFEPVLAERDQLAAQVEDLNAKLAAQTNPAPLPKEIDALLIEDDFNVLARQEADAEKILSWCDQHEDTGYAPAKDGEEAFTSAQIRKMRRDVEKRLTQLLPQARQLAQARAQKRTEAKKAYPELFDGKSEAHKIRMGFKARAPWIYAQFPQFDLWLGHMLEGEKHFNTRQGGAATTAPRPASVPLTPTAGAKPPTPPVLPSPGGAPAPATGRKQPAGIDTGKYLEHVNGGMSGRDALISVIRGL